MARLWRHSVRALWVVLAFIVIVYAVLVVLGRQLLPRLDGYQVTINDFLSERLGVEVTTQSLNGEWQRFSPRLSVEGLELRSMELPAEDALNSTAVASSSTDAALQIDRVSAELDLFRSMLAVNLIWEELSIGQASFTLVEDAEGRWSLSGLSTPSAEADDEGLRRVVQMLTDSKRIRIAKAQVVLHFYSGDEVTFDADDLLAENSGDFHRVAARLSVAGEEFASALLEGVGDPLDAQSFDGRGYLRFNRIDFSGPPGIVFRDLAPEWAERIGAVKTDVAAELWFDSLKEGEVTMVGHVSASEIPLSWVENAQPLKNLKADITGWLHPGVDWGLRLQGLDVDWMGADIQPINLEFSQQLGADWGQSRVAIDHLNLSVANDLLAKAELLPQQPAAVLAALNPRGVLRDFHIEINTAEAFPITAIQVQFDLLGLDSWRSAPAVKELSGYFTMKGESGELVLDTSADFAMRFPGVYDNFMTVGPARGRIYVDVIDQGQALAIGGGPVFMDGEAGSIRAAFELYQPLNKEAGVPDMTLIAGLRDSHSRHTGQFIPDSLEPTLKTWLDDAIGDMDIEEGGFIWRGPLVGKDFSRRSIQVYARVANGQLKFDPHWPEVTELSAYMSVDGSNVEGRVLSASMGKARIQNAGFHTSPGSSLLGIKARVRAPLVEAIDILRHSPLQPQVEQLAQWQLGGKVRADLDLAIPLSRAKRGEHYRVAALISDGHMRLASADIAFEALNGDIAYNEQRGLFAEQIKFNFWDQPVAAKLNTRDNGDLEIESSGEMNMVALPIWPAFVAQQLAGNTAYQARYRIPVDGSPTTLKVTSDLLGLTSTLPAPLNKLGSETQKMDLTLSFKPSHTLLETRLGDNIAGVFRLEDKDLIRGDIALGGIDVDSLNSSSEQARKLTIRGRLDKFNFDQWQQALNVDGTSGSEIKNWNPKRLNPTFDLQVGEFLIADYLIPNLTATGGIDTDSWRFYGSSDTVAGEVGVPLEAGPLELALDYLVLPKPDFSDDENNTLRQLLPGDLPEVDFSTLGLRIGDDEIGELGFSIRHIAGGVRFENIIGEVTGLVSGSAPDGSPAALTWVEEGGQHRTDFSGALQTYDLAGVLKSWGMPVILNSQEAVFFTELSWAERPWEINPVLLDGVIALNFKEGNFYRASGVAGNALIKLIGVINFDTWLRRLRLDFSDVFDSGVSYDELEGSLAFNSGTLVFQPIKVNMPSGKMRLHGEADLVSETIDARLVATLPVGTNLPWVVALVGGLPAAVGVYLTSRLFDKQVDKMSSLSYRVEGSWDDPELKVEKIFSDKLE
ncbi:MAG: hypothetical protein KBT63_04700 [Porticoccaceae bacterium]|nr:hypothetical protein [Porticoccaceae bacterium]